MSDHKEHISHYSAADIQRYVQGKLSAAEMHAMEKAALDDPFLADAMEGVQQAFEEHKESVVMGQLQELQQQFNTRTNRTARVAAFKPFRYWQAAAAAAVVLIIAGVWMFKPNGNNESVAQIKPVIAKTEEQTSQQPQSTPPVTDNNESSVNSDSITQTLATAKTQHWKNDEKKVNTSKANTPEPAYQESYNNPKAKTENPIVVSPNQEPANADKYFDQKERNDLATAKKDMVTEHKAPVPAVANDVMARSANRNDNSIKGAPVREAETELITIARADSPLKLKKASIKEKNLSGVIKGQVTDPFRNPVANAYVQVQLQKTGNTNNLLNNYTTDKWGYFKIPVSDSVVDVAVNVSGYGTQNFTLQNNAALNQLQLQPANYSDAYAPTAPVTSNKQLANNYKFPNVMLYDAEPAYGWVAFGQYLEKNKIIPAGAESVTGNVIVSFEVNKKGLLSDYKIEQSLSKAHDGEAIRLIKQGPSWKLNSGRKARITVMVKF